MRLKQFWEGHQKNLKDLCVPLSCVSCRSRLPRQTQWIGGYLLWLVVLAVALYYTWRTSGAVLATELLFVHSLGARGAVFWRWLLLPFFYLKVRFSAFQPPHLSLNFLSFLTETKLIPPVTNIFFYVGVVLFLNLYDLDVDWRIVLIRLFLHLLVVSCQVFLQVPLLRVIQLSNQAVWSGQPHVSEEARELRDLFATRQTAEENQVDEQWKIHVIDVSDKCLVEADSFRADRNPFQLLTTRRHKEYILSYLSTLLNNDLCAIVLSYLDRSCLEEIQTLEFQESGRMTVWIKCQPDTVIKYMDCPVSLCNKIPSLIEAGVKSRLQVMEDVTLFLSFE